MKPMTYYFDQNVNEIARLIDRYPFEDKDAYCRWLNQQFLLVRNSTRYLALAAALIPVDQSQEFRWWTHHLSEELDHDKTLVNDLKALGQKPEDEPLPETRALILAVYQDIQRNGPDALVGYALMFEGLSCKRCSRVADRVEKAFGTKASFLRLHGHKDEEHYPEGLKRIEEFPADRKKLIVANLEMSTALYVRVLERLINKVDLPVKVAA